MIVSRQNQRLKTIRGLKSSKGGDRALLEGPHLIAEALSLGLQLEELLATPDFLSSRAGKRLSGVLPYPPIEVEPALLEEIADADSPRGVLATALLPRTALANLSPPFSGGLGVFAEGIQDPGNLGALARSAEAAGAGTLALSEGCAHPNHPRALRASAGSLLRMPTAVGTTLSQLRQHPAPAETCRLIALVPRGGQSLYDLEGRRDPGNLWLVVGSEGPGLTSETRGGCDLEVTIPLTPPVESLNTTVAAAVALFELQRKRARPTESE